MKATKHLIALTIAASGFALADHHKADIFVNAGPLYFFDIPFEDTTTIGFSAGYVLDEKWTLEAAYNQADADYSNSDVDLTGSQYRLDALYHLDTSSAWRPYVAFGAGDQTADYGDDEERDTLVNIGGGVKRDLGSNWQLRADLRNFSSLDSHNNNEYNELALTLGVGYRFGTSSPAVAAAAPAPEPVKDIDTDGDGVFDSKDQCPNTPKTHKVDEVGCSLTLTETVSIELNITFDSAKAVIKPEFESEVAKLAEFMGQYANTVVTIEGHTDSQGADAYNQKLSQSRADSVKAMLITKYGIAADRVNAVGYGESKPVADNATADGREQNRRVVGAVSSKVTKTETK